MLSVTVVEEVYRLLQEGNLSQRKIAVRLGVSRGTVGAIAKGRRGLYGHESGAGDDASRSAGPPQRCSRCGFRVYMPCLVCQIRAYRRQRLEQRRHTLDSPPPRRGPTRRGGPARVA